MLYNTQYTNNTKDVEKYRCNVSIKRDGEHCTTCRSVYNVGNAVFEETVCRSFKIELELRLLRCRIACKRLRPKSVRYRRRTVRVSTISFLLSPKAV